MIKKNNFIVAAGIGAVVIMAWAYYAYDFSTGPSDISGAGDTVKPVTTVANIRVPRIKAPVAGMVSVPVIQPTGNNPAGEVPVQARHSQTAHPPLQISTLQSAVNGDGNTIFWQTASSSGTPSTQTGPPATVATTLPKPKTSVYSTHLVRKEASPYELLQGTVIPATLETGIKSDLPGEITAVVSQPIYNSVSGAYVLIPAGSKLVGTYQSKIMAGATRVGVDWTRILFPNGTYMNVGGRLNNVLPKITARHGYAINVTKDLVFPGPYRHGNQIARMAPASAVVPTIANPYH